MERCYSILVTLCVLGFFKEFRPSEPFFLPFLNGPKNLTESVINNDIYPIATYSNMSLLIIIFLLTDWLKYKPIILLQGLCGLFTWSLLIWCHDLLLIQVSQISYGLFCACEVAYSSYLYAKVDKKVYQKATGQTKAALLISKAGSSFIAQVLIMYHLMDFFQLNYLTLSSQLLATVCACFLPPVTRSSLFNRTSSEVESQRPLPVKIVSLDDDATPATVLPERGTLLKNRMEKLKDSPTCSENSSYNLTAVFLLWRNSMKNVQTLKWSLWFALYFCGYLQVTYYIQLLWQEMLNSGKEEKLYHGFSNSFNSLAGALCAYSVGFLNLNWSRFGESTLGFAAILQGGLLLLMSYLKDGLIVHYVLYALFKVLYQASSTIASAEIAKSLELESYGLVFGMNQFLALVGQSILTLLVTQAFLLGIRPQFILYGTYFIILGVGFMFSGVYTFCATRKRNDNAESYTSVTFVA